MAAAWPTLAWRRSWVARSAETSPTAAVAAWPTTAPRQRSNSRAAPSAETIPTPAPAVCRQRTVPQRSRIARSVETPEHWAVVAWSITPRSRRSLTAQSQATGPWNSEGGGLLNFGATTLTACTISGNSALRPAGSAMIVIRSRSPTQLLRVTLHPAARAISAAAPPARSPAHTTWSAPAARVD